MIKKLIFILTILLQSTFAQMQFSHFPLQPGNKWYFRSNYLPIKTIIEAVKDTLMSNGKNYTRLDRLDKIDSVWTRNTGWRYLREENGILYNFPNDTLLNYSWNDSTNYSQCPSNLFFTEVRVDSTNVFGKKRVTYFLYVYYPYEFVSYSDSIGYNALYALQWRDWMDMSRYLSGCIINNITYGDTLSSIDQTLNYFPTTFKLYQNYPNPFNPATLIKFELPKTTNVKIEIFNLLGQKLNILLNEKKTAGLHEVIFIPKDISSGVYLYKITAGKYKDVKKMILIQ